MVDDKSKSEREDFGVVDWDASDALHPEGDAGIEGGDVFDRSASCVLTSGSDAGEACPGGAVERPDDNRQGDPDAVFEEGTERPDEDASERTTSRVEYGREPYRRAKDRPDLTPAPRFYTGPSWAHVPGGRKRHEVSFRGSSRSYHDAGHKDLKKGQVHVQVQSLGGPVGASRFSGRDKLFADSSPLSSFASAASSLLGFLLSLRVPRTEIPVFLVVIVLALVLLIAGGVSTCSSSTPQNDQEQAEVASQQQSDPNRVSFFAVGDNLPDATIGKWAQAQAADEEGVDYDYRGLYEHIKPYVQAADLSYVDEESIVGGNEIGPVGYPTFNVTDEMADALESTGFDLVGAASNHTYDHDKNAVVHAAKVLNGHDFTMVGINSSKKSAAAYKVVKSGNVSLAFLDYTYGLNGNPSGVADWLINVYGEKRLKSDVAAAKKDADVVIVAMHWGTEKQTTPDEEEKKYAKVLADAGADLVIGSHPHVIQPMEWVKGEGGNKTLVCYSLGNFLSNHDNSNELPQLEGSMSCDFVKDSSGKVSIENVKFMPLVNHRVLDSDPAKCEFGVYALKDYTNDLAQKHSDFGKIDDPVAWMKEQVRSVMGQDFEMVD